MSAENIRIEGIILKELSIEDASPLFEIFSNDEIKSCYSEPVIQADETGEKLVNRFIDGSDFVWTIRLVEEPEEIVGICALHHWNKEKSEIEIGGTLLPEYWGKNIMKSAFTSLIDFSRKELMIAHIIGKTRKNNRRAIRLVEKLGFERARTLGEEVELSLEVKETNSGQ